MAKANVTRLFSLNVAASAGRPLRVMAMGDSVMAYAQTGLAAALQATGVVRTSSMAFPGWGLTTSPTWRTNIPAEIRTHRPQVVIGTWGWDQNAARADPARYRRLLDQALALLLAPGNGVRGVVFLQYPPVGQHFGESVAQWNAINAAEDAWNDVVASEAAQHPRTIGYLPVASSLELDGRYATWLPDANGTMQRVRTIDAVHLCPAGTARLAAAVLTDLQSAWDLPDTHGLWWAENWTGNALYDTPPGTCPADHPPG